ncbi:MAG: transcriptional regulator, AraC family [Labilithrix sp.]|nr:transcriptional regulator, AraC family [Labilithrix sp.]
MLREEVAPIVEIAASLGYKSESAFSHAFKRVTGIGPRAYRNGETVSATDASAETHAQVFETRSQAASVART